MNKELFLKALATLFYTWGGDTPPEAYWAANDFLEYFEAVNCVQLGIRFEEPDWYKGDSNSEDSNYEEVIEKIKQI